MLYMIPGENWEKEKKQEEKKKRKIQEECSSSGTSFVESLSTSQWEMSEDLSQLNSVGRAGKTFENCTNTPDITNFRREFKQQPERIQLN